MPRRTQAFWALLVTVHLLNMTLSASVMDRPAPDPARWAAAMVALELGLPLPTASPEPTATGSPPAAELPTPAPTPTLPPEPTPTPAPTPTASPAPTPEPTAEPTPTPAPPEREGPEIRAFTDAGGLTVKNHTTLAVDIPALLAEGLTQRLPAEGPQILIVHTHGTEAYDPVPGWEYASTDIYRTTDERYNVIRVGDALQEALTRRGFRVEHDRGLYDHPSYNGSYSRSGAAVESWLARYPDIGIVIDLHRDAIGDGEVMYKAVADLPEPTAQLMLVAGTGENGLEHPCWRENLKLALALQQAMEERCPTLTRPVDVAAERYNQHLTTGSLILEVGTCANTLEEALRAVEYFAEAAEPVLRAMED